MKKIRLRRWFVIVLSILLMLDLFVMILDCDSTMLLFVKTLITATIAFVIYMILELYYGLS